LHFFTLGTYWVGVPMDDVKPNACAENCQFHTDSDFARARAAS
jgi:hypothetical protein